VSKRGKIEKLQKAKPPESLGFKRFS